MKKFLLLSLMLLTLGGATSVKAEKLNLTFNTQWYCNANWNSETNTLSWGTYPQDDWMDKGWTFMAVNELDGSGDGVDPYDMTPWTKLHMKLSDWDNVAEQKLTLYFKEKKGNTQSMDWVVKVDLTPDDNGIVEVDLTKIVWKTEDGDDINKNNINDVTIYGGVRTDDTENGSVKVTEAWLDNEEPTAIAEVNDTKVADGAWYTINGMKLEGEPTEKGIYIYNGKKVAIQ